MKPFGAVRFVICNTIAREALSLTTHIRRNCRFSSWSNKQAIVLCGRLGGTVYTKLTRCHVETEGRRFGSSLWCETVMGKKRGFVAGAGPTMLPGRPGQGTQCCRQKFGARSGAVLPDPGSSVERSRSPRMSSRCWSWTGLQDSHRERASPDLQLAMPEDGS